MDTNERLKNGARLVIKLWEHELEDMAASALESTITYKKKSEFFVLA